jgi:RimJ/RimL family protein N-acetyltransferase
LGDETVIARAIFAERQLAGFVMKYEHPQGPEICYWLGREYWGQGIASHALAEFLRQIPIRPLNARAAKDNLASLRVLEKCGFAVVGSDRGFAHARGMEVDEVVLKLKGD